MKWLKSGPFMGPKIAAYGPIKWGHVLLLRNETYVLKLIFWQHPSPHIKICQKINFELPCQCTISPESDKFASFCLLICYLLEFIASIFILLSYCFSILNRYFSVDYLSILQNRLRVGLVIADGLPHLENEVHKYFPSAKFQKCVVHKMRNIVNKVRPSDKPAVAADLKHVFANFDSSASIESADRKLQDFIEKWRKNYPSIKTYFAEDTNEYYFTYISFPCEVRRMIYTTNQIESLNKKLRKATKNKQSFENTERLLDFLFVIIKDFEEASWMKHPVTSFSIFTSL